MGKGSQKVPHTFNVNLKVRISKAFMYILISPHSWCYGSPQSWVSAGRDCRYCWAGKLSKHFVETLGSGLILPLDLLPRHLEGSLMTLQEVKRHRIKCDFIILKKITLSLFILELLALNPELKENSWAKRTRERESNLSWGILVPEDWSNLGDLFLFWFAGRKRMLGLGGGEGGKPYLGFSFLHSPASGPLHLHGRYQEFWGDTKFKDPQDCSNTCASVFL